MHEASEILGVVAVMLLIGALAVWTRPQHRAQLRRLNGSTVTVNDPKIATLLLLAAVGLSGVAAFLAIASWIVT